MDRGLLVTSTLTQFREFHYDVIKWKHFPRYWPFVRGIHRSPVNSPQKAGDAELWCFLCSAPWINGRVNIREAGDLRRHYDVVTVMSKWFILESGRVPVI